MTTVASVKRRPSGDNCMMKKNVSAIAEDISPMHAKFFKYSGDGLSLPGYFSTKLYCCK